MADDDTTKDRVQPIIDQALTDLARVLSDDVNRDGAVCTNWVLVAEWSTTDGEQWISRYWDENRPVWQRDGLLHEALYGHRWDATNA
jgi:hypothetical protein